jgi:hypothetical protein
MVGPEYVCIVLKLTDPFPFPSSVTPVVPLMTILTFVIEGLVGGLVKLNVTPLATETRNPVNM